MLSTLSLLAFLMGHPEGASFSTLALRSPAFNDEQIIPRVYTCKGKDLPIPIAWEGVPLRAKSLAVIMMDLDSPRKKWYHWSVYNIPVTQTSLQNVEAPAALAANSFGIKNYYGPCPKDTEHHYAIHLYALDINLPTNVGQNTIKLREAMRDHIIASAELVGRVTP